MVRNDPADAPDLSVVVAVGDRRDRLAGCLASNLAHARHTLRSSRAGLAVAR